MESKHTIEMENRAWMGIRLVSKPHVEGNTRYIYEIGFNFVLGLFYLDEYVTQLDTPKELWHIRERCHRIAYSERVKPLINWIEQNRNVKVKLNEDITRHEEYNIREAEKLRIKHKWKWEEQRKGIEEPILK